MAVTRDPSSDPEAVPLGLLRRYLLANGWRRAEIAPGFAITAPPDGGSRVLREMLEGRTGGRRNFEQFILSEDGLDDVELILPREQTSPDYLRQFRGAIRTLSDLEGGGPVQVIADVRRIGFDVVRSRIPTAMVFDDAILLEVATGFITGVKSLLAATATTEIQPDPYFLRVKKEATAYADGCRFGHTFRGSFGFTVESPIVPNDEPALPQMEQPRPFQRRVIERLVRGVTAVCTAVDSDDTSALVTSAKTGFSANACEQFAKLVEETAHSGLVFSFAFSPEWRPPAELIQTKEFLVGPRHVEVTKAAAKELRRQLVPRAEKVFGRVVRLASDADPSDLLNPMGDREIAIQWSSEELGDVQVRVSLGAADYLLALEAHRAGRPVMVSGTLERRGRPWVLSNPTEFTVP
jgi:hypothetical protein